MGWDEMGWDRAERNAIPDDARNKLHSQEEIGWVCFHRPRVLGVACRGNPALILLGLRLSWWHRISARPAFSAVPFPSPRRVYGTSTKPPHPRQGEGQSESTATPGAQPGPALKSFSGVKEKTHGKQTTGRTDRFVRAPSLAASAALASKSFLFSCSKTFSRDT